jgi:hypothetical protein
MPYGRVFQSISGLHGYSSAFFDPSTASAVIPARFSIHQRRRRLFQPVSQSINRVDGYSSLSLNPSTASTVISARLSIHQQRRRLFQTVSQSINEVDGYSSASLNPSTASAASPARFSIRCTESFFKRPQTRRVGTNPKRARAVAHKTFATALRPPCPI